LTKSSNPDGELLAENAVSATPAGKNSIGDFPGAIDLPGEQR
jgi:hypothetical protein